LDKHIDNFALVDEAFRAPSLAQEEYAIERDLTRKKPKPTANIKINKKGKVRDPH
jgi:hypothetical protein